MSIARRQATVLYDRDWGSCRWALNKVLAWDRGAPRPVEIQSQEGARLLPSCRSRRLGVLASDRARRRAALRWRRRRAPDFAGGFPRPPGEHRRSSRRVTANRERFAGLLRIDASCQVRRP